MTAHPHLTRMRRLRLRRVAGGVRPATRHSPEASLRRPPLPRCPRLRALPLPPPRPPAPPLRLRPRASSPRRRSSPTSGPLCRAGPGRRFRRAAVRATPNRGARSSRPRRPRPRRSCRPPSRRTPGRRC